MSLARISRKADQAEPGSAPLPEELPPEEILMPQAAGRDGDAPADTLRGAGVFFLLVGCLLALMGMGLIALQQTPYADKIARLSALGFPPGAFVTVGILLAAISFPIREIIESRRDLRDLGWQLERQARKIQRSAVQGSDQSESNRGLEQLAEQLTEVLEAQQQISAGTAQNRAFIRDAEIKIDTSKRTLEDTHRRLLEIHQQISEGPQEAAPAPNLVPDLVESIEKPLATQIESVAEAVLANRGSERQSWSRLYEELGAIQEELGRQREEIKGLQGALSKTSAPRKSSPDPALRGIQGELVQVMKRLDQVQNALRNQPQLPRSEVPGSAAADGSGAPRRPQGGAAGVNSAIAKLREMKG